MFHRKWIIAVCFVSLIFSNLGLSAVKQIRDGNLFSSAWSKCIEIVKNGNRSSVDVVGVEYYMRLYSLIQRVIDKRVVPDPASPIVKLNNGYLDYAVFQPVTDEEKELCQQYANEAAQFQKRLAQANIPSVFVLAPAKTHQLDGQTPRGACPVQDNVKADLFLQTLKKNQVPCYDLRTILKDNPQEHYRLFFRGDHHWKPEYALMAFRRFISDCSLDYPALQKADVNWLNHLTKTSKPLDYWEQFQINKTGALFVDYDREITHYEPDFKTDFTVEVPCNHQKQRGAFNEVNLSDYYMHNPPYKTAINHNIPTGRIVLIKDSFALPWFDFLALSFHEVFMFDLRSYKNSPESIIKEIQPDLVIFLYHPGALTEEYRDAFNFNSSNSL